MLSVITTLSLTSGGYQLALKEFSDKKDSYESSVLTITTGMSLLFAGIYFLLTKELDRVIGLPKSLIILMLIGFSGVESSVLSRSKVIKYCCDISYVFFLAQLFSNTICIILMVELKITNNLMLILMAWLVCTAIAVLMHEVFEKPIKKLLNNLADKRNKAK